MSDGGTAAIREGMRKPQLSSMMDRLRRKRERDAPRIPLLPRDGRGLPLSSNQKRLWFIEQLQPGTGVYNIGLTARLRGILDPAALQAAFRRVVARHESLRTRFATQDGEPVQFVLPDPPLPMPVVDLTAAGDAVRPEVERVVRRFRARPFDLERAPLLSLLLLRLTPEEHVLAVSQHHIVGDGWSTAILIREALQLYRSALHGETAALPALPVQYADYAAWRNRTVTDAALAANLEFWRRHLEGAQQVLELPWDRPRPSVERHRGELLVWSLSPDTTAALRRVAQGHETTLFVVLLAAFHAVLHRWSGQDDLVLGVPVAHRDLGEIQHLIGFFVNTLALRARLDGERTFSAHLADLHELMLQVHRHQGVPFERLVEALQPERSLSHAPLFQVVFTYQNVATPRLELPGLTLEPLPIGAGTALFDLTLHLEEGRERLAGWFEYSTDLFDATTIRRLQGYLRRVLETLVRSPASRIADASLPSRVERHQVLAEWNDTARVYPRDESIPELFEAVAGLRPDAVALHQDGRWWSYGELDRRSAGVAARLAAAGVGPEELVALEAGRSPDMVAGLLGILRAGGAYLPLDPSYPAERLAFMLQDAGVRVLLASGGLPGRLPPGPGPAVRVVSLEEALAAETAPSPPSAARSGPRSLAYALYTSGSTGRPKGVAVEHRSVVRLVRGADYADLGEDDVLLQLAPVPFDASTLEIWGALLNGGRLEVFPLGTPSLAELGRGIEALRVTTLWLTAGLFHQMVEAELPRLAGVRQLLAGGDVLSPQAVHRVRGGLAPGQALINGYGPTEGTTFTCCHRMGPDPGPEAHARVPVGRPIANTRVYLLEPGPGRGLRPVPPGGPGELFLGGDGVARGYLARPALTAAAFVPDPFGALDGAGPGARLYRTGDLARWLPSGRVDFLGRLDHQVKVRGFRIELGEIESPLLELPEVSDAAVVSRARDGGEPQLVAYVVSADPHRPLGLPSLRSRLAASLPEYMLPSALVLLDALPLTPSGKLHRQALPAPHAATADAGHAAPRGPMEEMLAALWAEVIGVDRVSIHASFFEVGGHSLLALRLLDRIRGSFGLELPLATLFERPTVAAMAATLEEGLFTELPPADHRPLQPVPRSGPEVPLSFAQERLWFFDQLHPGASIFNVPLGVRFRGELDGARLAQSLNRVVARHEALRTVFASDGGEPRARVSPPRFARLPVIDLTGLGAVSEAEAGRLAAREATRPFDLARGPLARWLLLRLAPRVHHLRLTLHHVASDGWSLGVLVRELGALYEGGGDASLPDLPVQYADYADWERRAAAAFEGSAAYWLAQLGGAPTVLEVPTDRPRPPRQTYRSAVRTRVLDGSLVEGLAAVSRASRATLYMTLLAAFQVFVHGCTERRDLVVGSPFANRRRPEVEELIGFFVNMVALRARFEEPGLTFRQHLERVRGSVVGASIHQGFPFDRLVQRLQPERDPSRPPIFQVVFAYQENPGWELRLAGLEAELLPDVHAVARYDLHLSVVHHRGRLHAALTYNLDLYEPATADLLLERFEALLRAVSAEPGTRVDELVETEIAQPMRRDRTMQRKALSQSHRDRLVGFKKAGMPPRLIEEGHPIPGESLPLLVRAAVRDVDLAAWTAENRASVEERLRRFGAILFRGFDVPAIDDFRRVAEAVSPDLLDYGDPSTPRTEVSKKVYTSTEYPPDQFIPLHNELSYNYAWPMKIFFYCVTPATTDGETPLADSRRIYEAIDPEVRQRFVDRGVMYVRNFGEGYGLPWQQVFRTDSRAEVEEYCRAHGFEYEWKGGDRLRTRHVRPAVVHHPDTGELVWFNQANVHHYSSLPEELRRSLLAVAEDPDFPLDMNACYGDRTKIDEADVVAVRRAFEQATVKFPWQQGDVLVADNMLVAHGRSPFTGPRKIMVLMAESRS